MFNQLRRGYATSGEVLLVASRWRGQLESRVAPSTCARRKRRQVFENGHRFRKVSAKRWPGAWIAEAQAKRRSMGGLGDHTEAGSLASGQQRILEIAFWCLISACC